MFFRKYHGNRRVEDIFLPGDDVLYRPVIERLQSHDYYINRYNRINDDDYGAILREVMNFLIRHDASSTDEKAE